MPIVNQAIQWASASGGHCVQSQAGSTGPHGMHRPVGQHRQQPCRKPMTLSTNSRWPAIPAASSGNRTQQPTSQACKACCNLRTCHRVAPEAQHATAEDRLTARQQEAAQQQQGQEEEAAHDEGADFVPCGTRNGPEHGNSHAEPTQADVSLRQDPHTHMGCTTLKHARRRQSAGGAWKSMCNSMLNSLFTDPALCQQSGSLGRYRWPQHHR